MQTQQWTGVTRGGNFGQKFLINMFKFINVKAVYWVLWLVIPFYMLFGRKSYKAIYHYFRHQWGKPPLKAFYSTYRNHIIFGQCMFDRFAVYAGQRDAFKLQYTGYEHIENVMQSKSGCVVVTAHTGNFEISGYLYGQMQKDIFTMTYRGESEVITSNRAQQLNTNNITALNNSDDMSHIFILRDALLPGQMVTMMCDRMLGNEKRIECQFLNGRADFPKGSFTLATKMNVPIFAVFVMKEKNLVYHLYVTPLEIDNMDNMSKQEKISAYAQQYVVALEKVLHKYPEQWFNFYEFWK
jgi:predicted LPLAT superfamily acyltransferase